MVTVRVALSGFVSVMVIGVAVLVGMRPRESKSNVLLPMWVCVTEYCPKPTDTTVVPLFVTPTVLAADKSTV